MRLLVIGHDAHRSGAQIHLLRFLEWIAANRPDIDVRAVFGAGGSLLPEYRRIGEVDVLAPGPSALSALRRYGMSRAVKRFHPDLIYVNSLMSAELLDKVWLPIVPTVTHIHELGRYACKLTSSAWIRLADRTDRFIAVSDYVRGHFIEYYGISREKIDVLPRIQSNSTLRTDHSAGRS